MSHPVPGHEYGENEYPDKGYHPTSKKPKGALPNLTHKLMGMARKVEGLRNTKHFGAKRRARHKMAQRIAKGEDIF